MEQGNDPEKGADGRADRAKELDEQFRKLRDTTYLLKERMDGFKSTQAKLRAMEAETAQRLGELQDHARDMSERKAQLDILAGTLQRQMDMLTQESKRLEEKERNLEDLRLSLEERTANLDKRERDAEERISKAMELTDKVASQEAQLATRLGEVEEGRRDLAAREQDLESRLGEQKEMMDALGVLASDARSALEKVKRDSLHVQEQMAALERERESGEALRMDMETCRKSLAKLFEDADRRAAEAERALDEMSVLKGAEIGNALASREKEFEELRRRDAEREAQEAQLREAVAQKGGEVESLTLKLREMESRAEEAGKESGEAADLRRKLAEAESAEKELKSRLAKAESDEAEMKSRLAEADRAASDAVELRSRLAGMEQRVSEAEGLKSRLAELEPLAVESENLKERIRELETRSSLSPDDTRLRDQLIRAREELTHKQMQIDMRDEELRTKEAALAKLEAELASKQRDLEEQLKSMKDRRPIPLKDKPAIKKPDYAKYNANPIDRPFLAKDLQRTIERFPFLVVISAPKGGNIVSKAVIDKYSGDLVGKAWFCFAPIEMAQGVIRKALPPTGAILVYVNGELVENISAQIFEFVFPAVVEKYLGK